MALGKFKRAPKSFTFPISLILHVGLMAFACILMLAAVSQPVLWIVGKIPGEQAAFNFLVLASVGGLIIVVDTAVAKVSAWLQ